MGRCSADAIYRAAVDFEISGDGILPGDPLPMPAYTDPHPTPLPRKADFPSKAPEVGDYVAYRLSEKDAVRVNFRRRGNPGEGSRAVSGQVLPGVVVRAGDVRANLHVFLDGPDALWAVRRREGDEPGQFRFD